MLEWIKKKFKNQEEDKPENDSREATRPNNEEEAKKLESKDFDAIQESEATEKTINEEYDSKDDDEENPHIVEVDVKEELIEKETFTEDSHAVIKEDEKGTKEKEIIEEQEETKNKPQDKGSLFQRLKKGLTKTRDTMGEKINDILGNYVKIDEEMLEDLEDLLISADMGMETTMDLIDALRERIRKDKVQDPALVKDLLSEEIEKVLIEKSGDPALDIEPGPAVLLIVGVNGVGKTTTIGKITQQLKNEGKSVLIAAGDTFRAAAIEQLKTWGQRSNTDVIAHQEGADPAAVIYDAIQAAKSRKIDVLICDTAGRLHNKKNLMNELEKIHRIISREYEGAKKEVLLVLDATTGQNAILQAKTFDEATNLTGIVLTKLDGTAKGGVVLPLVSQLEIPIKFIGVGEGIEDLQKFNSSEFSKALMGIE